MQMFFIHRAEPDSKASKLLTAVQAAAGHINDLPRELQPEFVMQTIINLAMFMKAMGGEEMARKFITEVVLEAIKNESMPAETVNCAPGSSAVN